MSFQKFPSISQWKQLFKTLRGLERIFFLVFLGLAILSAGYLLISVYIDVTKTAPTYGGTFTEGVVGQPRFINPIYGETNDVDRTLIGLIYSGLMTYDKDGKIVKDLADSYQISEDGKTYTFQLKDHLTWQDGAPLTTDDVVYTIKTIQNSDYKSPLRASWLNVGIKKISDKSFSLSLGSPYNSFLENCTIKIIPQHIWKNVLAESFALSPYNLQPIGSGPYNLSDIQEIKGNFIKDITLSVNNKYHGKLPYISKIYFQFFTDKNDLIAAANKKTIDGFSVSAIDDSEASLEKQVRQGWNKIEKFNIYPFSLSRYFAVFFNTQNSRILSDSNITQALNFSVDKKELIQKITDNFKEKISAVNSPILPEYFGYPSPTVSYSFNIDSAKKLLDKSGFKDPGTGQREKPNTKTPAFQFKSYLSEKSAGNEVTELQGCLARLDASFKSLLEGETSGKFGKGTGEAVTAFQKKYIPDVPSTGEVGPGTRKKTQ